MNATSLMSARGNLPAQLRDALRTIRAAADGTAKRMIAAAWLLTLLSSGLAAAAPLLLGILVDELDRDAPAGTMAIPACLVGAYVSALWLSRSLGELRNRHNGNADQRIHRRLSICFFHHVISLPFRFHVQRHSGATAETLANGLLGYRIVFHHLVNSVLPVFVEFAAIAVIVLSLRRVELFTVIVLSAIAYAAAFRAGAARVSGPARSASSSRIDAGAVFMDSLLNLETVKSFGGEAQVARNYRKTLRRNEHSWRLLYAAKMQNGLVVASVSALSLGLAVGIAVIAVRRGAMSIGDLVLVNAYFLQLVRPLETVGFAFRDIVQGLSFIEKMAAIQEGRPELLGGRGRRRIRQNPADLAFENVSLSYDRAHPVLCDVSFFVPAGRTLAVVGSSGSGKSSLVRLLLRLVEPSDGRIRLGGTCLAALPLASIRGSIATVPQDTSLFNDTIAGNIAFGTPACSRDDVVNAARIARMHDFIVGLPLGYDTVVGEHGVRLSGGEKQRIAIARAAVRRAPYLILDEPTSALDTETERSVLQSLDLLARRATTILIAHRLSTVVRADEIVVLDHGRIIERGQHEHLMRQDGRYAAMWRAQSARARRASRTGVATGPAVPVCVDRNPQGPGARN